VNQVSDALSGPLLADAPLAGLTAKQRQVLTLIADNRTSKEIAGILAVSESAVNQRIETIRARLGGVPRAELARLYRELSQAEFDGATTCNLFTGENFQLSALPLTANVGNGKPRVEVLTGDGWRIGGEMASGPPLAGENVTRKPSLKVVPELLEGENGSLNRIAVIVGIALGLLMLAMVGLGVAQALNTLG
jgi:DNA-binding CsgD family transcriptional regulator